MNARRVSRASALALFVLLFLGTTVIAAKAFMEPGSWSDPAISVRDADDTPGKNGGVDPWYDDSKGSQPQTELLYVFIDWDNDYIYVRWDVKASAEEIKQVHYLLKIDAINPISPPVLTHSLRFEADDSGNVAVRVRDSVDTVLWTGGSSDYLKTTITVDPGDPFTVRTACEARFPWSALGSSGLRDIMAITAESYAPQLLQAESTLCFYCCCWEVMDYICIDGNPVPWLNSLALTLVPAVVLVAFFLKKREALSTSKNSKT
jgi:hypothetical protein